MGKQQFTRNFDFAFKRAEEEARSMGCDHIGTEHLLLGLMKENEQERIDRAIAGAEKFAMVDFVKYIIENENESDAVAREQGEEMANALRRDIESTPPNIAAKVFEQCGISLETVREAVVKTGHVSVRAKSGIGWTTRIWDSRDRSKVISREYGERFGDTGHLLLALLECNDGGAHKVLAALNIDKEMLIRETRKLIAKN